MDCVLVKSGVAQEVWPSTRKADLASRFTPDFLADVIEVAPGTVRSGQHLNAIGAQAEIPPLTGVRLADGATYDTGFFGNIWWHKQRLAKGARHPNHKHDFDHVTFLMRGALLVEVPGNQPVHFTAGSAICIRKDVFHQFTALEDDTIFLCTYALRDVNGNVADVYTPLASPTDSAPDTPESAKAKMATATHCGACNGCST